MHFLSPVVVNNQLFRAFPLLILPLNKMVLKDFCGGILTVRINYVDVGSILIAQMPQFIFLTNSPEEILSIVRVVN